MHRKAPAIFWVVFLLEGTATVAWVPTSSAGRSSRSQQPTRNPSSTTSLHQSWLDALTGNRGGLQPVSELPYGDPILPTADETTTVAIAERGISFTGEDFDVVTIPSNNPLCRVRGALLHLPGKDQMRLMNVATGQECAKLDRKLVSITPTYDLYRSGTKIGWIEKVVVALRDTFEFHAENAPKMGPFKPPAAYKLEGDFLDRKFIMKTDKGDVVAVVSKDGFLPQWNENFNHYQVQIAPGMVRAFICVDSCSLAVGIDSRSHAGSDSYTLSCAVPQTP